MRRAAAAPVANRRRAIDWFIDGGALVLAILATAAAARTEAARAAGEAGATALTSGFAVAFVLAAGILALGALSAYRMLPDRAESRA